MIDAATSLYATWLGASVAAGHVFDEVGLE